MKKLLPLLMTLCFFALNATGQNLPKNTLKFGFGTAYLGSGDYFGNHQHLNYQRSILPFLSLGLNASRTNASKGSADAPLFKTEAKQGDVNLLLVPIRNKVNAFKIGGGASYRFADHSTLLDNEAPNPEFSTVSDASFGYTALAEYELYIAKYLVAGTRASFQQYKNGDKVFYWGLNLGFRF